MNVNIHQQLEEVFRNVFNDDSLVLHDDMTSSDVPGWDSVAHINLMFSIESAFGFQFLGNELAEFKNVGELKEYVAAKNPQR